MAAAIVLGLMAVLTTADSVRAQCHPIEVTWYSPTGIAGCEIYGEGLASHWAGPGVARNDCLWPWTGCQAIRITSLETRLSVTVRPTMFCDCYTGTSDQRVADLPPSVLRALGLDPSQGLYPVRVTPASMTDSLPDTGMANERAGRAP